MGKMKVFEWASLGNADRFVNRAPKLSEGWQDGVRWLRWDGGKWS